MQVIDETESDLKALVEQDFGPISLALDDMTLLNWLHYRARLIPQRRRVIITSPQVGTKLSAFPVIHRIERALATGGDVSPWLSDDVRKQKSDPKADMLFNDWQISHFHLGNVSVTPHTVKVGRTRPLLFAYVGADSAVFLDVQPHRTWAMRDLLRILRDLSPESMPELKGVLGTQGKRTEQEILWLRKAGLSTLIEIDGRFFFPACGTSSSLHATRLVKALHDLRKTIAHVRFQLVSANLGPSVRREVAQMLAVPLRLGVRLIGGQLIVLDKVRGFPLATMPAIA
jgi:hypothetical protein